MLSNSPSPYPWNTAATELTLNLGNLPGHATLVVSAEAMG